MMPCDASDMSFSNMISTSRMHRTKAWASTQAVQSQLDHESQLLNSALRPLGHRGGAAWEQVLQPSEAWRHTTPKSFVTLSSTCPEASGPSLTHADNAVNKVCEQDYTSINESIEP